jgi:hypothetical protein
MTLIKKNKIRKGKGQEVNHKPEDMKRLQKSQEMFQLIVNN